MPIRGLRIRILFNIATLLIVAMVLIDLVIVATVQKVLVANESDRGHLALSTVQATLSAVAKGGRDRDALSTTPESAFVSAARSVGAACAILVQDSPPAAYRYGNNCRSADFLARLAHETALSGRGARQFVGTTWVVFWYGPRELILSAPLPAGAHRGPGSVCLAFDLERIYAPLRTSQKIFAIYIVINTLLFSAVGFYRITRLYLAPVQRLAQRADSYSEGTDLPFVVRKEDNELKVLSNALNQMTRRMEMDKEKLRQSVRSLASANEELQRAQAEVIRAEKFSTVGRLASGVAHEIGNPLGIVLGYLELLQRRDTSGHEREEYTHRAQQEVQRISSIIQQLLDFSRPAHGVPETLSARTVMSEVVDMLRVQPALADIDFSCHAGAAYDTLFVDRDQLKQVLINLVFNAADAIAAKMGSQPGRIVLFSELTEDRSAGEGREREGAAGSFLTIRCRDNGIGIPADQIGYVFDPFFTTKGPQKGTGLGLSVSYMIVERMGGRLEAVSSLGDGTTFSLHLPLFRQSQGAAGEAIGNGGGDLNVDGCRS